MKRMTILALITAICCIVLTTAVFADDVEDLKKDIKYLKEQVDFLKATNEELMGDQTSITAKQEFKIAGFIEFRFEKMDIKNGEYSTTNLTGSKVSNKLWGKTSYPNQFTTRNTNRTNGSFSVRNLNVYTDFKYGNNIRSFMEVKYMEYPSGSAKYIGDMTVADDGNGSFISHGSIYIERAWLDYKIKDAFRLQFGKMLTPFGIWNVEHGAPVLPSIRVPASISYGMVPTNFVGINAHGNKLLGNWEMEYNLWLSNGRGVWNVETNANKGIGASVNLKAPTKILNKLVFGGSYYKGKENLDYSQKFYVNSGAYNSTTGETIYNTYYDTIKNAASEYCLTAHLALSYKKLDINAEYVYNNIKYDNYNAVDNMNNRLFYRPDNTDLALLGAAATRNTYYNTPQAVFGGATIAAARQGGFITGQTPLTGGVTADTMLLMMTPEGFVQNNNYSGMKAADNTTTKFGYAMPLNTLNAKRSGYYVMARFMLTPNFYPYFTYEAADPGDNDPFPPIKVYMFGLNYKPVNVITCKVEYSIQKFKKEGIKTGYTGASIANVATERNEDFNYLQMSVSYAF